MELYLVSEDDLERVPQDALDTEEQLETHLVKARGATIGGVDLLFVGRQGSPGEGGIFDVLAIDERGNVVVVELKRDRAPRSVVAQALEYASAVRDATYDDLAAWYETFRRQEGHQESHEASLADIHAAYFEREEPLGEQEFNAQQRLVLLGEEFDDVALDVADFLREYGLDIICVTYQSFRTASDDGTGAEADSDSDQSGLRLLTTEAVRRPLEAEPTRRPTSSSPSPAARQRESFWSGVLEEIGRRSSSSLRSGWTPRDVTSKNVATVAPDVVVQFGFKTTEACVEARLIIRDDAALYEALADRRERIENELEAEQTHRQVASPEVEWQPPDQSRTDAARSTILQRCSIGLDDESTWGEYQTWLVDTGEAMQAVFGETINEVRQ